MLADDGGINHATLHMAGVFTTADFFLSPDSHGGTFITTDAPCYRAGREFSRHPAKCRSSSLPSAI